MTMFMIEFIPFESYFISCDLNRFIFGYIVNKCVYLRAAIGNPSKTRSRTNEKNAISGFLHKFVFNVRYSEDLFL